MKEGYRSTNESMIPTEVDKIRFLKSVTDKPEVFLYTQNELLYQRDLSIFHKKGDLNEIGLPASTDNFYQRERHEVPSITDRLSRILNIGSGSESSRKLPAINTDVSSDGKPDVIADAQYLPFKAGIFSVVRASHVLEHIPQDELESTLEEWKRVLHKNGELHIAVPDADITFQEIIDGKTPKGKPAFSLEESTAPLAQIYGLGYDNLKTDSRWLHKIIFSYSLLEYYLKAVKFHQVNRRTNRDDMAYFCGIDDDSQNHYSLLVSARREQLPYIVNDALPEKTFREKCHRFKDQYPEIPPVSFIIPVYNESRNLQHFLAFLEHAENQIGAAREFIFVINGCTDNSEEIIRQYIPESYLDLRIIESEKGIVHAFETGINSRNHQAFVGKLDADTILHPHALDLMHMFLIENPEVQVTYSEPTPLDSQNMYNEVEHNPVTRSKRLYIHVRASLYKHNPFEELSKQEIVHTIRVEDIFLSFYYAYFYGLDSIAQTPHALVYSKTVKSFEDLVKQISRSASEMKRVFDLYPPLQILERLLERQIHSGQYREIIEQAKQGVDGGVVEEWTRIKSTK